MKIDKITIGLSIVLVAVVALTVFSASLPASGSTAEQNASVSVNTTAIKIVCQNGSAAYVVNYWNFSGETGATVTDPQNEHGETQDVDTDQNAVACLNNTNDDPMSIHITAGTWDPSDRITSENFNVSNHTCPTTAAANWTAFTLGTEVDLDSSNAPGDTITANGNWSLWLKVQLNKAGTSKSTFNVTSEL